MKNRLLIAKVGHYILSLFTAAVVGCSSNDGGSGDNTSVSLESLSELRAQVPFSDFAAMPKPTHAIEWSVEPNKPNIFVGKAEGNHSVRIEFLQSAVLPKDRVNFVEQHFTTYRTTQQSLEPELILVKLPDTALNDNTFGGSLRKGGENDIYSGFLVKFLPQNTALIHISTSDTDFLLDVEQSFSRLHPIIQSSSLKEVIAKMEQMLDDSDFEGLVKLVAPSAVLNQTANSRQELVKVAKRFEQRHGESLRTMVANINWDAVEIDEQNCMATFETGDRDLVLKWLDNKWCLTD